MRTVFSSENGPLGFGLRFERTVFSLFCFEQDLKLSVPRMRQRLKLTE